MAPATLLLSAVWQEAGCKAGTTRTYIGGMAHNNGMVPKRGRKGLSDNAAKFRAAVDKVAVEPAGTAYDPGPPEDNDSLVAPIGDLPLHGATGAELAGFVPHRPVRPEKSEGGITFKLVSEYEPAGDQPTAIKELVAGVRANDQRTRFCSASPGQGKTFTMARR